MRIGTYYTSSIGLPLLACDSHLEGPLQALNVVIASKLWYHCLLAIHILRVNRKQAVVPLLACDSHLEGPFHALNVVIASKLWYHCLLAIHILRVRFRPSML
jgi:hypothetical protein